MNMLCVACTNPTRLRSKFTVDTNLQRHYCVKFDKYSLQLFHLRIISYKKIGPSIARTTWTKLKSTFTAFLRLSGHAAAVLEHDGLLGSSFLQSCCSFQMHHSRHAGLPPLAEEYCEYCQ